MAIRNTPESAQSIRVLLLGNYAYFGSQLEFIRVRRCANNAKHAKRCKGMQRVDPCYKTKTWMNLLLLTFEAFHSPVFKSGHKLESWVRQGYRDVPTKRAACICILHSWLEWLEPCSRKWWIFHDLLFNVRPVLPRDAIPNSCFSIVFQLKGIQILMNNEWYDEWVWWSWWLSHDSSSIQLTSYFGSASANLCPINNTHPQACLVTSTSWLQQCCFD